MNKGKVARLAGFVGALGVSTVLVTTAIQGTGAYFEDSATGTIAASSGHLTLDTGASNLNLSYANLMPGQIVPKTINYQVGVSSGGVDLWMVFDQNDVNYLRFTGAKHSTGAEDGGLGGYGYFSVSDSHAGGAFTSGNLAFPNDGTTPQNQTWPSTNSCSVDAATGRGGSSAVVTADSGTIPWCGVPAAILLRSNMTNGNSGTITIKFGLDGYKQTQQNQQEFGADANHAGYVPFHIVATQHGILPGASA